MPNTFQNDIQKNIWMNKFYVVDMKKVLQPRTVQ